MEALKTCYSFLKMLKGLAKFVNTMSILLRDFCSVNRKSHKPWQTRPNIFKNPIQSYTFNSGNFSASTSTLLLWSGPCLQSLNISLTGKTTRNACQKSAVHSAQQLSTIFLEYLLESWWVTCWEVSESDGARLGLQIRHVSQVDFPSSE